MTSIAIDGKNYPVKVALPSGIVIADAGGAFSYASFAEGEWRWYAGHETQEMAAALKKVIDENGGFDTTSVVREPA
jgi:hypothetical protein